MENTLYNHSIPYYSLPAYEKKHIEFFHIDFAHVGMSGKANIPNMLNFFQETAWQHARRSKFGYHEMLKQNTAFVISKMLVKIKRLPQWDEIVSVETWIHPPDRVRALREFTMRDNNRNLIAAASISYIAINTQTRRLGKIPDNIQNCCINEDFLDEEPTKISPGNHSDISVLYKVKPSDMDMNQHVNNSRYVQWITDHLPENYFPERQLSSLNINFLHEANLGDELSLSFYQKDCNCLVASGVNRPAQKCIFLSEFVYK